MRISNSRLRICLDRQSLATIRFFCITNNDMPQLKRQPGALTVKLLLIEQNRSHAPAHDAAAQ
jgi:hypothetical protein